MSTWAELGNWDVTLPDETASAKAVRAILASVARTLEDSGCPLTDAQTLVFLKAIAQPAARISRRAAA